MNKQELKISFLFFEDREISTYPSIINSAKILAQKGHKVKIFVPPMMKPFPSILNTEFISSGKNDIKSYISFVSKKLGNCDLIVVFSIEGLFIGAKRYKIFSRKNIPVIYFSMELIYKNYFIETIKKISCKTGFFTFARIYMYLKLIMLGGRFVRLGIAQDEKRCELLKKEFPFIRETAVVPNSYMSCNDRVSQTDMKKRFNINKNKKILLFTGGFSRELRDNLNNIVEKLSDDQVLFLNIYSRDNLISDVKSLFESDIKKGKIVINEQVLTESEYIDLVRSSHIGLIWYKRIDPNNENMFFIGMSSGKLNSFLSCGIPVVLPDYFPGFVDLKEKCDVGELFKTSQDIAEAVKRIDLRYSEVVNNIKVFYQDELEFSSKFNLVWKKLALML